LRKKQQAFGWPHFVYLISGPPGGLRLGRITDEKGVPPKYWITERRAATPQSD